MTLLAGRKGKFTSLYHAEPHLCTWYFSASHITILWEGGRFSTASVCEASSRVVTTVTGVREVGCIRRRLGCTVLGQGSVGTGQPVTRSPSRAAASTGPAIS